MKKNLLVLVLTVLLLFISTTVALADAAIYDMEPAGYYVYVKTPDGGLNIRSGPGTEYDKIMPGRIPDNVMLYIEYVSDNWGFTRYNGYTGWVALSQTTTTPPAPSAPPEAEEQEPAQTAPQTPTETAPQTPTEAAPSVESEQQPEVSSDKTAPSSESTSKAPLPGNNFTSRKALAREVILIVVIIIFVIIIAALLIVIINLKSKK